MPYSHSAHSAVFSPVRLLFVVVVCQKFKRCFGDKGSSLCPESRLTRQVVPNRSGNCVNEIGQGWSKWWFGGSVSDLSHQLVGVGCETVHKQLQTHSKVQFQLKTSREGGTTGYWVMLNVNASRKPIMRSPDSNLFLSETNSYLKFRVLAFEWKVFRSLRWISFCVSDVPLKQIKICCKNVFGNLRYFTFCWLRECKKATV